MINLDDSALAIALAIAKKCGTKDGGQLLLHTRGRTLNLAEVSDLGGERLSAVCAVSRVEFGTKRAPVTKR